MIILPANTLSTSVYEIANSCRFEDGDTPVMTRTTETPTNSDKYTFSVWVKRGNLGLANSKIFSIQNGTYGEEKLEFNTDDIIWRQTAPSDGETNYERVTDRKFRDPSAWFHILIAYDSSDGTAGDRMKMYINGVRETSFSGTNNPSSNEDSVINTASKTLTIAKLASGSGQHFDGYFAEMAFVDGVAHAVTDFGEFDSDSPTIWKPKDISSGITWGNNGFWLDFEDSSALGNDVSGNNNDFSVSNLAATDQSSDSPTNNFATLNPLAWTTGSGITFSEGNLKIANSASDWRPLMSTMAVTTGKWYCEVKVTAVGSASKYGIIDVLQYNDNGDLFYNLASGTRAWTYRAFEGKVYNDTNDSGGSSYGDSFTTNDIIGIYLDCDNNKVYWAKNGAVQNSGTGISITDGYDYGFAFNIYNSTCEVNFGNPTWSLSSAVADDNGYGSFEYDPSAGTFDSASKDFYALCTKNLAEYGG